MFAARLSWDRSVRSILKWGSQRCPKIMGAHFVSWLSFPGLITGRRKQNPRSPGAFQIPPSLIRSLHTKMTLDTCPTDPNSFANTDEIHVKHTHLSLSADFDAKILAGHVVHTAVTGKDNVKSIVFDTSFLDVKSAVLVSDKETELKFEIAEHNEKYGAKLTVHFPQAFSANQEVKVKINYATTTKCTAIQWLEPSQTIGKKYPYLFSQCQAIHARSMLPCQDTPGNKHTWSADISVPSHLRALMSGLRTSDKTDGDRKIYSFEQKVTIPSYLIALAVGNLEGREIGPRSTVWSEPEMVEASAWEFKDTETFIATGESLLTPYEWGAYDLLVLPPSFPYGGMENPCLTFVTPTLLAGDRSLVDVVAHEIAHSWMGNLVTTLNWEHFWLNEGFTMFIERKITGRLHGQPTAEFDAIIGIKALQESIDHFDEIKRPEFSCMCPRLANEDPDDAFSSVPYEKGFNLLFYLERILGGAEIFEPYLKEHVKNFAHKSITTDDFLKLLFDFFQRTHGDEKVKILNSVDWDAWLHKPGMPPVVNDFDKSLAEACEDLASKWSNAKATPDFDKTPFDGFNTGQKVMFLEKCLAKSAFTHDVLIKMDSSYKLTESRNAEIRFRWQMLCLKANYEVIFPHVVTFLGEVGRMKYVRPLYRELNKCKNGSAVAKQTFLKHRNFYHPICAGMVAKDLGL
ncbi:peptidase family M1-domain-containing protein [Phlyctochytrium arcticum]|nr:peptidase family M1-domain-containing protein [Phlyctochytrium arcticum]